MEAAFSLTVLFGVTADEVLPKVESLAGVVLAELTELEGVAALACDSLAVELADMLALAEELVDAVGA